MSVVPHFDGASPLREPMVPGSAGLVGQPFTSKSGSCIYPAVACGADVFQPVSLWLQLVLLVAGLAKRSELLERAPFIRCLCRRENFSSTTPGVVSKRGRGS